MEEKNRKFYETIRSSSLSKTIRNSLVPTKLTQKNIERTGIILEDQLRAEKRQELKDIKKLKTMYEIILKRPKVNWKKFKNKREKNYMDILKETKIFQKYLVQN